MTQQNNRFPTSEPTRDEFLDHDGGEYCCCVRLTQTAPVGHQVGIEELTELGEEIRWLIAEDNHIPIQFHKVDDNDIHISPQDVKRRRIDEYGLEDTIESLATEYDVALNKHISFSNGLNDRDPFVLVKYYYGWDHSCSEMASNPNSMTARSEWVGGERGQPETMKPKQLRIKSVTTEP